MDKINYFILIAPFIVCIISITMVPNYFQPGAKLLGPKRLFAYKAILISMLLVYVTLFLIGEKLGFSLNRQVIINLSVSITSMGSFLGFIQGKALVDID